MARTALLAGGIFDMGPEHFVQFTNNDPAYPMSNLNLRDPQIPAKATTTSCVIRVDTTGFGGGPEFFACINHNLFGATVTISNTGAGGGGTAVLPVPARTVDGHCTNFWHDLRGLAGWGHAAPLLTVDVTISGASANAAVGQICWPYHYVTLSWQVGDGPGVEWATDWPMSEEINYNYSSLRYYRGMRIREARGKLRRNPELTQTGGNISLKALLEGAKGQLYPLVFIPDTTVNDCWFVIPETSRFGRMQRTSGGKVYDVEFGVKELSMGLPL